MKFALLLFCVILYIQCGVISDQIVNSTTHPRFKINPVNISFDSNTNIQQISNPIFATQK